MRSSTSNSETVYPEHPWLKTWLLAVAVAATALLGWEAILRSQGHRPSVVDDKALWATQRERIYPRGDHGVMVLLGECPDTSHIDRSDAPRFTLRLAKVLKDHGLFDRPCQFVASSATTGERTTCHCAADSRCAKDPSQCRCRASSDRIRATSRQEACEVL